MTTTESITPIERDPDKLSEWLPWYRNGTLSDADRQWVQAQLDANPAVAAMLKLDDGVTDALNAQAAELPADIGWEGLLRKVRADGAPATVKATEKPVSGFMAWFGSMLSPRVGMAMAALLAVQAIGLGVLVNDRADDKKVEYRSVGNLAPYPVIRAVFADSVDGSQLRDVLLDSGLTIVDGPNQLGEYQLFASAPDLQAVAEKLKQAGVLARFSMDNRVMSGPAR